MLLKKLTIFETFPNIKIIREIHFKDHLNLIVDDSKLDEKANGIGKTTALRLIDICLGAQDKSSLYIDKENNIRNHSLGDYINNNKIVCCLIITDDIINSKLQWELKVELFDKGRRYINDESYSYKIYNSKLNEILFNNSLDSPTFRQLIKMFVRINANSDNNKFLRFLEMGKLTQYENIYNFLFGFKNQDLSEKVKNTKELINKSNDDISIHKKINKYEHIDSLRQELNLLNTEGRKLTDLVNSIIDSEAYKENESKIQEIKIIYAGLMDQISKYKFRKSRVVTILSDAKKEQSIELDDNAISQLYGETKIIFGELNRTFLDLVHFNAELVNNKIHYFEEQLYRFDDKLAILEKEQNELFDSYSGIIMLIENNKIEEYENLQKQLTQVNENRGKIIQIIEVYEELISNKVILEVRLKTLENDNDIDSDQLSIFNQYFAEYSGLTNNEECYLYRTEKGFPLSIDNVSRNFSTGTKKSVIAAFDLAYQSLANDIHKKVPKFIVHDVIETMDRLALMEIVNIINNLNSQYIVAVLNDKIEAITNIKESDIILRLSECERLFKID